MDRLKDILGKFNTTNIKRSDEAQEVDILGMFSSIPISGEISGSKTTSSSAQTIELANFSINPATEKVTIRLKNIALVIFGLDYNNYPDGYVSVKIRHKRVGITYSTIYSVALCNKNGTIVSNQSLNEDFDRITYSYTISWS